ncbi:outer membrane protein transport protein [Defluviimonas sp. SAOS-178_SWC]|uniref:outer membrane protein transport protein n=1 Tax=Defluviimonas sp. SAOS-178_SWC TaxID=3121287 RepID=UPI00322216C9
MGRVLLAAGALTMGATSSFAGGLERSAQSAAILFETGKYAEFSIGNVAPDVTGNLAGVFNSGNMLGSYTTFSLGYKQPLGDNLDLAVILDQPIGADVDYPTSATYPLAGTTAQLDSMAVTGLVRYKMPSNVSVFGGVRLEYVEGTVNIRTAPPVGPIPVSYTLQTDRDYQAGYIVGIAWEKPEIAARIALTYNSAITHSLEMRESSTVTPSSVIRQDVEIPQSVNLEFQTGIAADTLLFGSVRWVDWTAFVIDPPIYNAVYPPRPLVSYNSDRVTYNLGIGRKFNESWSGAVLVSHEPSNGDITGNLGPTDGYTSVGLAATYTYNNMKITGGVRYIEIGGATTTLGAQFKDNSGIGAGVRIAYSF